MTGSGSNRFVPAMLALAVLALSSAGSAEAVGIAAKVVWVRGDVAYIASEDSSARIEGERLTFLERDHPIAAGVITRVLDPWLAAARVTSGSLARIDKLDRLRMLGEQPRFRPPSALRVGFPSRRRSNLIFACPRMTVASPLSAYVMDSLSENSYRAVHDSTTRETSLWPDTLLIRRFDESADEEIALERGELEVAVFWPGELSAHMRESRRWPSDLYGSRARGLIVASWDEGRALALVLDGDDLAPLNEQLFRGDLAPFPRATSDPADSTRRRRAWPGGLRFSVDAGMPGQPTIERFLNRSVRPNAPVVRLHYDDPALHWIQGQPGIASTDAPIVSCPLFAIRCPVVCAPDVRPYIMMLGPDHLVNMLICEPREP